MSYAHNLSVFDLIRLTDPIWLLPPIACTDFDPLKKTEDNSLLMKQLFYQHVYEMHRNSFHIYTDGSKIGEEVGCAVLNRGTLYSRKLFKHTGIYNAELQAVLKAVKLAKEENVSTSTVIFTDSLSVKQSIEERSSDHPLICKILHHILAIHKAGGEVTICWVPAHVGIPQNVQADEGAKAAAQEGVPTGNTAVHYRDYYPLIRSKVLDQWRQEWQSVTENKLRNIKLTVQSWESSSQKSRRMEVLLCRLRLGHTRLTHKWLLEGSRQPVCQHCSVSLTVRHLLAECNHYTPLRNRIYPHTVNMNPSDALKHILAESNIRYDAGKLLHYLTETGTINEI